MGSTVLDAGVPIREGLHVYTHCLRGTPGGVALLAINNSQTQTTAITLPIEAERYTLSAEQLESPTIQLNGQDLKLGGNDELPGLPGKRIPSGPLELAPASITFLTMTGAGNGELPVVHRPVRMPASAPMESSRSPTARADVEPP